MNNEVYFFLGTLPAEHLESETQNKTHFFVHRVNNNEKFKFDVSVQIFNSLINDDLICSPDENVVIYEIYPTKTDVTFIQHIKASVVASISKEDLQKFLNELIIAERPELYLIKYNYDSDLYLSFIVDDATLLNYIIDMHLKIANVGEDILEDDKTNNYITINAINEGFTKKEIILEV